MGVDFWRSLGSYFKRNRRSAENHEEYGKFG